MYFKFENIKNFEGFYKIGLDGGIGRRAGFKIQFSQGSAGSIPARGTKGKLRFILSFFITGTT